jgi:hypothetical protein
MSKWEMTMTDIRSELPRFKARRLDRFEFRLLVALTFPLFFVAALLSRVIGVSTPRAGGEASRPSVFSEARSNVEATIACAFMG